jgi:hypothetical protein
MEGWVGEEWQAKALAQEQELELEEEGEEKKTRQLGTHFQPKKSPMYSACIHRGLFWVYI